MESRIQKALGQPQNSQMHSSFPTMEGKFPSNVLWAWRKGHVPMETPSLCLLTRAPTAQSAWGLLGLSGDTLLLFDFLHNPGRFLLSLHPCPTKLCPVSKLPHLQKTVTPRMGGNNGASLLHPALFPSLCLPRPTSSKSDLISESRFLFNNFTKV